jgi:hypothetical protein
LLSLKESIKNPDFLDITKTHTLEIFISKSLLLVLNIFKIFNTGSSIIFQSVSYKEISLLNRIVNIFSHLLTY